MGQTTVTDQDLRQMLAIAQFAGDPAGEALPWELLDLLARLVECDRLSVSGQDTPRWEFFADQKLLAQGDLRVEGPWAGVSPAEAEALDAAYRTHYWGSTCSYPDRTGDVETVTRDSDRRPDRERRHDPMYADYCRPAGIEHEILVCLRAGAPQRTVRLMFWRGSGPDFSERDLAVLTLLRPHLQAAYDAAERRRRGTAPITRRQRQIMEHVAGGLTNAQVARRLGLSEATVRKHLENVFARLGVTSRTAAVARLDPPL